PLGEQAGYAQVVSSAGNIQPPEGQQALLAAGPRVIAVAQGRTRPFFYDSELGGTNVRVYVAPFAEGQALQAARSLEETNATMRKLAAVLAGVSLAGIGLAALLGGFVGRSALRPVRRLMRGTRYVAATQDLSRRVEAVGDDELAGLARSFNAMLEALAESRRAQRQLIADASHELRTPLTSVLANLELLQASLGGTDQADDREIVDSALRSSRRMGRLISDLLLLARADAGRLEAHRRVDLAEVAGDAAAEAAPLMGAREFAIENERPLRVEGSRDELHRMVLNLLDNAIRHTQPDACIELALREDGGDAVVEVGDDGPGIPESMRTQVFDRFVRGLGPADTARGNGTGLGLAIVSAVAESHGGRVEATESKSGGALFVARIPLAETYKSAAKPLEAL
ncbi:MAG: sensor histidine kinase, partial [Solirubrobacterales bacterium]